MIRPAMHIPPREDDCEAPPELVPMKVRYFESYGRGGARTINFVHEKGRGDTHMVQRIALPDGQDFYVEDMQGSGARNVYFPRELDDEPPPITESHALGSEQIVSKLHHYPFVTDDERVHHACNVLLMEIGPLVNDREMAEMVKSVLGTKVNVKQISTLIASPDDLPNSTQRIVALTAAVVIALGALGILRECDSSKDPVSLPVPSGDVRP